MIPIVAMLTVPTRTFIMAMVAKTLSIMTQTSCTFPYMCTRTANFTHQVPKEATIDVVPVPVKDIM